MSRRRRILEVQPFELVFTQTMAPSVSFLFFAGAAKWFGRSETL
jgi:hypothetical protein